MKRKVLHILSQRPSHTGSGITLDAMIRQAQTRGWDQHVVAAIPHGTEPPSVGGLSPDRVHLLPFGNDDLPFPIPGMSDVMPYESTRFSDMIQWEMEVYLGTFANHLEKLFEIFEPDVIHAHHVWLLGSIIKDIDPVYPVVTHCHATGFRQMDLCPDIAEGVAHGCARNEAFVALHSAHARQLEQRLGVSRERVHVVGAGYRNDLFVSDSRSGDSGRTIIYVGKYASAKGLPWLLDAFEEIYGRDNQTTLHIGGDGSGAEAEKLRARMSDMPGVKLHGAISQEQLANLLRSCDLCVLPSLYEGLPLVLVEALASGCRLACTKLPGVAEQLVPHIGFAMDLIELPRLAGVDVPRQEDISAFTTSIETAIESALGKPPLDTNDRQLKTALGQFTWGAVFERIEKIWKDLVD